MSESDQLVQLRLPSERARMWRSVDEFGGVVAPDDEPGRDGPGGWSRRTFMKLLGASFAIGALEGCDRTVPEKILPYSTQPRDVEPGKPRYYATAMLLDGFATGIVAEAHEGRPTKIEGNPDHPFSLGGTTLWQQALVLGLYDPDRARRVRHEGQDTSWEALDAELRKPRLDRGAGLRLLLEPTTSPTLLRLVARVRALHPELKTTFFAPVPALANTMAGAALAFGRPLQPLYDVGAADVIVSLDADLLGTMPGCLAHARGWSRKRRIGKPDDRPNRMYAIAPAPTVTANAADHRLRKRSSEIAAFARALAAALPHQPLPGAPSPSGNDAKLITAVAKDLAARAPGSTLVVVGERQPPAVHALGYLLNAALGNVGKTVRFVAPLLPEGDQDLAALVGEMRAGKVDTLVMLEGNPVYTAPADLDFARALERVPERIYLGAYDDETGKHATWLAPAAHPLEAWGDGLALDGTLTLQQPLIRPLWGGRSAIELVGMLAGERQPDGHRLVRETHANLDFDAALQRGLVPGSAAPTVTPAIADAGAIARALAALKPPPDGAIEVNFALSPTLHDGRFSNNAWLLEQPEPSTKLCWDNAVLVSPATATRLGLHSQDLVAVELDDRRVSGPILVAPGHADDAVTLWLGYGRRGNLTLADGVGFDAYRIRTSRAPAFADGHLARVAGTRQLATTQLHFSMHGRPIALSTTLDDYRKHPDFAAETKGPEASLMPPYPYEGLQWAMSIDLSICTGCSACMLGCQSENNLPVVGKEQVLMRREMHWLRIDSYFFGSIEDPGVVHQPMMCQHCETAPCEYVCPVNATVHSSDGLNEMVYNRCVGTRFCSNNCPYKVRRFNWFNWNKHFPANEGSYQLVHNPDVTVRDRGVMEKCTYCVQRIRETEIRARIEDRPVRPGEILTACQQACPTGAIQFDSLSHPDTPMARWRKEPRAYSALNDQGTRPRTMYLARVDNPNPELG